MNFEKNRLGSFNNWPANAPVDARRIAKAGFYYLGQNLEVQCFCCGGKIAKWNYNDTVMTLHRTLYPNCSFVVSPALSGNVPVINSDGMQGVLNCDEDIGTTVTSNQDHMCNEISRLNSFHGWPISFIVTPESLAKAGFYYAQQGDKVKCPYCFVIIGRWERGDDPFEEHRHHSPSCSFIQQHSLPDSTTHQGIVFRSRAEGLSDREMKSLGVQNHRVAKHPKYNSKDTRLETFTSWPGDLVQTPSDLAEAGFYYSGSGDHVRCFHCDGGLRQWDSSDDPWVEHARWFPDCGFVMLEKGDEFIKKCILDHPPIIPEVKHQTQSAQQASTSRSLEEHLEALMNSPSAIAALHIGLDLSRVKMAIRHKLELTGSSFSSAGDLIEAALDIQLDEEAPFNDSDETWVTPLQSPQHRSSSGARPVTRLSSSPDSSDSEGCLPEKRVEIFKAKEQSSSDNSCKENPDHNINTDNKVTLEEENRKLKEARQCKICMDSEVSIVFLPCGHLVTCVNCAHSLADCPVCRRTIKATVRTFLS